MANIVKDFTYQLLILLMIPNAILVQPTSYYGSSETVEVSPEKHLIRHLLVKYSQVTQHGRPVVAVETAVPVKLGLGLIQMELDEKEKALSMSLWAKYIWVDEYLSWSPENFHNISYVKLASSLIWIPDIMLYNTAETELNYRDTLVTVFNNGTVLWVPHQRMKSSCSIDVTNFPFDTQICHMWFGSWTYTTNEINLTMAFDDGIDFSTFHADFKDTSQWNIAKTEAERRVLPSIHENPNYAVLTFTLELKRNLVFASYILTLPCVFLACLTLVVFWLPPDRPDRTALAMSVFASFLLLLLILVEAAPPTASSVPSLGIYYCFNMVIIMLAVFLSSLVVNICQMGESGTHVPNWIRKITIDGPLRHLCLCVAQSYKEPYDSEGLPTKPPNEEAGTMPFDFCRPLLNGTSSHRRQRASFSINNNAADDMRMGDIPAYNQATTNAMDTVMRNLTSMYCTLRQMEFSLHKRLNDEYEYRKKRKDWKSVAIIMDRLFFVLYNFMIVLSIAMLFPRPGY